MAESTQGSRVGGVESVGEAEAEGGVIDALMDLIDALNDELRYEVSKTPEVQRQVKRCLAALGSPHYSDAWWLS